MLDMDKKIIGKAPEAFPRQGNMGRRVECVFKDGSGFMYGTIVRSDCQLPFEVIVRLDDNRYVRNNEVFVSYNTSEAPVKKEKANVAESGSGADDAQSDGGKPAENGAEMLNAGGQETSHTQAGDGRAEQA